MDLNIRFRTLLNEKTDAPCLIAGEILIDHAAAREYQREFLIRNFFWRVVFNRMELRFAIRMVEAFLEQSRRTWMLFGWTRPEDSVVPFDLLPTNSVIIRIPAPRC